MSNINLFMSLTLATIFFPLGCSVKPVNRSIATADCYIEEPTRCPLHQTCMNIAPNQTECREIPQKPDITFMIPIDSGTELVCTHASGIGSHSWPNAFYALDLASPYDKPSAIIRASAEGIAYVFADENDQLCPEPLGPPGNTQTDNCGQGWGNRIKILHRDGYYSFYAHLDKFLVKTGQEVRSGQAIGIEGATGLAGHRHLHWSVQKLPGLSQVEWEKQITWDGQSTPL